jgi:hypothetical protein
MALEANWSTGPARDACFLFDRMSPVTVLLEVVPVFLFEWVRLKVAFFLSMFADQGQ